MMFMRSLDLSSSSDTILAEIAINENEMLGAAMGYSEAVMMPKQNLSL